MSPAENLLHRSDGLHQKDFRRESLLSQFLLAQASGTDAFFPFLFLVFLAAWIAFNAHQRLSKCPSLQSGLLHPTTNVEMGMMKYQDQQDYHRVQSTPDDGFSRVFAGIYEEKRNRRKSLINSVLAAFCEGLQRHPGMNPKTDALSD